MSDVPGRGPSEGSTGLVLATKVHPPRLDTRHFQRSRLTDELSAASERRLVLIDAPVGYGKTTLLADWMRTDSAGRPFAWVSLDPSDSDPGRFLAYVVEALRTWIPDFGGRVLPALHVQGGPVGQEVVSRIINELAALERPAVLVLDDFHTIRGNMVHELVSFLVEHLAPTLQVVLSTRADPSLSLGRLRARGGMVELRAADLRFDEDEARTLVEASGIEIARSDLQDLLERTEGWPAGMYLAALSLRDGQDPGAFVRRFAGTNRHVADYLTEEVLRGEEAHVRSFLTRTSVLDRITADLCDAVLLTNDSRSSLARLERSNLFLLPLDDRREWYRYHHLFRDLLRAELARSDSDSVPDLHRRASAWFEAQGLVEEAVDQAIAGGDQPAAARLVSANWLRLLNAGRSGTVRRWIDELGEAAVTAHPSVALAAAWTNMVTGHPEPAATWLAAAERAIDQGAPRPESTTIESGVAVIRGLFGKDLLEMQRSLRRAAELDASPTSTWRPYTTFGLGMIDYLKGDLLSAQATLDDALEAARGSDPIIEMISASELSMVMDDLGDRAAADSLAAYANNLAEERSLAGDPRYSFCMLAVGRAAAARGDIALGHDRLEEALETRSATRLSPWPTLQIMLALAPVRFDMGDADGARTLMAEARSLLDGLGDAGDIPGQIEEQSRALRSSTRRLEFGQELTDRELGVLRMLLGPLTLREIGRELYLSPNTIKSHIRAIYRKLGVSSRSEAVSRARELGLVLPVREER